MGVLTQRLVRPFHRRVRNLKSKGQILVLGQGRKSRSGRPDSEDRFSNSVDYTNQTDGSFHLKLRKQAKWLPTVYLPLKRTSALFSLASMLSSLELPSSTWQCHRSQAFFIPQGMDITGDVILDSSHNQNFHWNFHWRCHPGNGLSCIWK